MADQVIRNEIATIERDITIPQFGGVLRPNDDTLLTRGGGRGLKIYDDIERDCHAAAVIQKRKLAVIARELIVEPASKSRLDVKAADLVKNQLANLSADIPDDEYLPTATGYDAVCLNGLDAILKGFSVGEVMWASDGSEIVAAEVRPKEQRRFTFAKGKSGYRLNLLTFQDLFQGEPLPPRKFLVQSFGAKDGNPFGRGLGYQLFWPVFFKRQDITFWLTFVDKFASPTPVGEYPQGTPPDEQNRLLQSLRSIAHESGIIIPTGTVLRYLEAQRSGSIDTYEKLARYMDEQISECVLGETGSTNQSGGGGSRARDEVGERVRLEIVKADADLQCSNHNCTLVKWIVGYNLPGANPPRIWRDCGEPEDLKARADRDKVIFDMGFEPDEQYINETYGGKWTKKQQPEPGGQAPAGPADPPAAFGECPHCASFAAGDVDRADEIADQVGDMALTPMDNLVAPLRRLAIEAKSLEEIRDGLLDLYGEMDPAELGALMAQAMSAAELGGRAEVLDGQ